MTEETPNEGIVIDNDGNKVDPSNPFPQDKPTDAPVEPEQKPDLLLGKYKSVDELASAYQDLSRVLTDKGRLPPESYVIDEKDKYPLDYESEDFKGFTNWAKDVGLNNAQLNAVLDRAKQEGFFDAADPRVHEERLNKEIEALGSDKDAILDNINRFANTRLQKNEVEVLHEMAQTASQVRLLNKIIRMNDHSIPVRPGEAPAIETKDALKKQLSTLLSDPDVRSNLEKQKQAEVLANKIAGM
jgi:hypothetical protein